MTVTDAGRESAIEGESAREEDATPAGLVLGTDREPSTALDFWVYVDPQRYLQLDDVVHVHSVLPDGRGVDVYGVVDQVRATQEGLTFASDVALVTAGILPAETAVVAHVSVTRVEPEIFVPPRPGSAVVVARGEAREQALFFDGMRETRFAIGLSRDGQPVYGNLDFLDGTKGAHVNISGVSGVATKTSYATFLLHALFEGGALGERAANSRAIIFNVKGEDLLFLDRANRRVSEQDRERYLGLGLPAQPFQSVSFFAPARRGETPLPDTGSRMEGVTAFFWTLHDFCQRRQLRFLFAEAESETSQLPYVVDAVEERLARAASATPFGWGGDVEVGGERVSSFGDLVDAVEYHTDPDGGQDCTYGPEGGGERWAGGQGASAAATATVRAFMRRLRQGARHVGHLIRGGEVAEGAADQRIDWERRQVTVVDLHRLHDRAQRFVVGVMLNDVIERREGAPGSDRPPPVFVVVDELNKYAPRDGHSPIKDVLLDIAERGRSLGVILIGAQQTASEVEQRIVANCSFRVVGRLDVAEAQRAEYRFLTPAARERAALLKPGTMIVQQPEIPVPLLVHFPMPAWATRPSEAEEAEDVFDRFDD